MGYEQMYWVYLHHVVAGAVSGLVMAVLVARRLPSFLHGLTFLLLGLTLADAVASGVLNKIDGVQGSMAHTIAIFFFVVAGDWRYFLVTRRYTTPGLDKEDWGGPGMWLAALAPVLLPVSVTGVMQGLFPEQYTSMHAQFLTYELVMIALVVATMLVWLPRRAANASPEVGRWLRLVTYVELSHYVLWATSDVLVLSGVELGYLLRLVPDVIYYALWIPALWVFAPKEEVA